MHNTLQKLGNSTSVV